MKYFIPVLFLCLGLFVMACEAEKKTENNNEASQEELASEAPEVSTEEANEGSEEQMELPDPDAVGSFGAEIEAEGAIEAEGVLAQLEEKDSTWVKCKGNIASVCKVKGCWMTMPLDESREMTVKFKDYSFFVPRNSSGKDAVVEGWAYKEIVSVDELRHLAEDNGASEEEVEEITEPEERITFMADGVIIESVEGAPAP